MLISQMPTLLLQKTLRTIFKCEFLFFTFEYMFIENKSLCRINSQSAAAWSKVLYGEVLALLQQQYYGISDNTIANFALWCRILLNNDLNWAARGEKFSVWDLQWENLPLELIDVTFIYEKKKSLDK